MGGGIGVDSVPGEGSLFWFEVPLEHGDAVVVRERAAFDPAPVRPLRLLVAEDVELNRDLLGEVLGRHGHAAVFAENGAEAVGRAAGGGFDLVLMDVQMPVMDGVEATRRIRALDGPAGRVPIVALTANVMAGERERYLAAGMDGCLTKPVDWGELFAALARHGGGGSGRAAGRRQARPGPPCRPGRRWWTERCWTSSPRGCRPTRSRAWCGAGSGTRSGRAGGSGRCRSGSEELAREAHSLKGTSGSFGLKAISAVAGEIEEAAKAGEDVSALVARLKEEVAATRGELRAAGLLDEPQPAEV